MSEYYELKLGELTRKLPLIRLNPTLTIASFVLLGDAELTHYAAQKLSEQITEPFDYIVTMESKGVPLAQELSYCMGKKRYIVLRKKVKDYMKNPRVLSVNAITSSQDQVLVLDGEDAQIIAGKKILLLDDVISSGGSMITAKKLVEDAGGQVILQAAILAEGEASERKDILYLERLPLFD
ncbi:MAG: phosphoribosyltransferase family protein [Liquorilactobacillus hordei]|uniref:Adenine phosphoribosyltransferase n=1 Tax=Liquorilactobacillus hordei DSM 19519 TaxID=1423759 RepID=A0A0R1MLV9_9LACO|nr:phosphoribosyltransferase family protein [Liquorilactobacillus hordei]KRL06437.1 adenine phosphoribosyltransferase [Liquorilactobacillus hordei DSM 19519]QYH51291.1 adenine phosphoribosyltransferase [Liquorilactobacillus hordei DSM 19519]